MAVRPLRPATDHRLGELLPHQLTSQTRPSPGAINLSSTYFHFVERMRDYHRFRCCPPLRGKLSTCYSPVCHANKLAFDLHVLSVSLAFILSQGQTLHKKIAQKLVNKFLCSCLLRQP